MKIRVYYEDTDLGGIVYHTNYIKYCERARSEIFFSKGIQPTEGENSGFVVRNIKASFLSTSTLGDILQVTTKIKSLKNSSIILIQDVWKEEMKVFNMEIVLVYIQAAKPCRIPDLFKTLFNEY